MTGNMHGLHRKEGEEREEHDFYATHPSAIPPLLDVLDWKNGGKFIYEPACGLGHLSEPLQIYGHTVISTDLIDRGYGVGGVDFLQPTVYDNLGFDAVITNPPYKCFSIDTECYTKRGWKKYNELNYQDEILSVNPETLELEWSKINQIIIKENDDVMYHFKKSHLDIMCTKNHRMFAFRKGKLIKKNNDLLLSQNIRRGQYIPRTGYKWIGKKQEFFILPAIMGKIHAQDAYKEEIKISMKNWLKFFGFWLADGYCRHTKNSSGYFRKTVGIKQKTDNAEIVRNILNELPFKYHEYYDNTFYKNQTINFEIHNEQLWFYMKQFGKSKDKFIPDFIKNLDVESLNLFIDFYFYGDGSKKDDIKRIYRTTSLKLIEDVQEILLKTGYLSHVTSTYHKGIKVYSINYSPDTCYNKIYFPSNKKDSCMIPYKGLVWCLNLKKNGVFLLRRNGNEFFCGNCALQFVEKSIQVAPIACHFLNIRFLESATRRKFFEKHPPRYVCVFSERIPSSKNGLFPKGESSAVCYAWFIWERDFTGRPEIIWL